MVNIRIQTNRLKKGMVIAADVHTGTGVVIVPKGTVVTKEVYELLTRHFVDDVIVEYASGKNMEQKKIKEFANSFQVAEEALSLNLREIVQQDKEVDIRELLDTIQAVVIRADSEVDLCRMLHKMEVSSKICMHIRFTLLCMLSFWQDGPNCLRKK